MTAPREQPVTWLLPVKDGLPYLRETLASIAAQRHTDHRVIAWDNGSTDGSVEVLRQWVPDRVPGVVVADRPMGLGASLARMVAMAETELCARIDADDLAAPDRLARQAAWMAEHPDVALLGGGMTIIDARGRPGRTITPLCRDDAQVRWNLRFGNPLAHPTVMLRRSAVLDVGNYADLMPGQDLDLWCRVAARHAMANLPDVVLHYREHDASITTRAARDNRHAALRDRVNNTYRATLYPGLDEARARRLYDLHADNKSLDVTPADLAMLRDTAVAAARAIGKPRHYFTRTAQYRAMRANLRTRYWKAHPLTRGLYPAAHRIASALIGHRLGYRHLATPSITSRGSLPIASPDSPVTQRIRIGKAA